MVYCICALVGYLHHLYKANESAFIPLVTIHNLRILQRRVARIRERILNDEL
jgi:tRNA-guanine family transglycosylase